MMWGDTMGAPPYLPRGRKSGAERPILRRNKVDKPDFEKMISDFNNVPWYVHW